MRTLFTLTFILISTCIANAQDSQIQLHLQGGMKFQKTSALKHDNNVLPTAVPTIGGGLSWVRDRLMAGAEFSYSDGNTETDELSTVLTGVNFGLLTGYRLPLNHRTTLVLQSGFGYGLQHASVSDKKHTGASAFNTAMYHNFIFTLPLSAMIQRVNKNGLLIGARVSYGINLMSNDWRFMENTHTERYPAGSDGVNIQLILGGLLNLQSANR